MDNHIIYLNSLFFFLSLNKLQCCNIRHTFSSEFASFIFKQAVAVANWAFFLFLLSHYYQRWRDDSFVCLFNSVAMTSQPSHWIKVTFTFIHFRFIASWTDGVGVLVFFIHWWLFVRIVFLSHFFILVWRFLLHIVSVHLKCLWELECL